MASVSGQTSISWWNTLLDEEADAAATSVRERRLGMGPAARAFEQEFAARHKAKYAVATTSGTAALFLAYWALGLRAGDEVLIPDGTFVATANAAAVRGVKMKLVDLHPESYTFDADQIEANLTSATRAIAVVHLNGRPADMARIVEIAQRHELLVLEDAAQAMYCPVNGRFLGTFGDIGCYSLGVTKLITTGQGGVVVTNRDDLYERAVRLRDHFRLVEGEASLQEVGLNLKFSDILASVGRVQLTKLDGHRQRCREEYAFFRDRLAGHRGIDLFDYGASGAFGLWNEIWIDGRDELVAFMAERGIQLQPVHEPLHRAAPYAAEGPFPASERHSRRAVYLPSGPAQRDEDLERVAEAVLEFAREQAA